MAAIFDARPIVVAIAGPNGAGKSTFHDKVIAPYGLSFVNADLIAREIGIDAMEAARIADDVRKRLVAQGSSFVFETVFSDPVGDKVEFLRAAAAGGYSVVLVFVAIPDAATSRTRVTRRVLEGGHDVPEDKIMSRFARTLTNLERAIRVLPYVRVYDNSDTAVPLRKTAEFEHGKLVFQDAIPAWLPLPAGISSS